MTVSIAGGNSMDVTLTQKKKPSASVVTVMSEDFSDITEGNSTSSTGSNSVWNGNANFPTVNTAYQAGGAVKIGKSKGTGSITSKELDLSAPFTVKVSCKGWTNIEGTLKVTVGSVTKEIKYDNAMEDGYKEYSVSFDATAANSTIEIATSAKRAFIDSVIVEK